MAQDDRRRQKKLEKKRMERKDKHAQAARVKAGGLASQLALAASWPVHLAFATDDPNSEGIESLFLVRRGKDGTYALASLLIDLDCLGVKDAWARMMPGDQFAAFKERHFDNSPVSLKPVSPAYIRKLAEQSVEFALQFGIEPHRDYAKVAAIFGSINAAECDEEFEFGREGKPFYIAGPGESVAKKLQITKCVLAVGGKVILDANEPELSLDDFCDDDFDEGDFDEGEDEGTVDDIPSKPVVIETTYQPSQS